MRHECTNGKVITLTNMPSAFLACAASEAILSKDLQSTTKTKPITAASEANRCHREMVQLSTCDILSLQMYQRASLTKKEGVPLREYSFATDISLA
jgi:hypothetical protein